MRMSGEKAQRVKTSSNYYFFASQALAAFAESFQWKIIIFLHENKFCCLWSLSLEKEEKNKLMKRKWFFIHNPS